MKKIKSIFSILVVISMLCIMIPASAAGTATFAADKTEVTVGDTFTVALNIGLDGGSGFSGGSIVIDYDKTLAELTAIDKGTLTESATTPASVSAAKANWTLGTAATESGTYLVATFKALKATDAFTIAAKTVSFTFRNPTKRVNKASDIGTATVKIKSAEATKYTVTFKNGDTVVATETATKDNGYKVTAPADPAADKGKVFDGWYDGETKFDADAAVTGDVTYVAKFSDKVLPDPTVGTTSETYEDAANYTNVWVGKYFAEPATGTKLTSFGVKYADDAKATFTKDIAGIEGNARIEFSVALIGVKTVDAISGTPFATADWAE